MLDLTPLDSIALVALALIFIVPGLIWMNVHPSSWQKTLLNEAEWHQLRRTNITITIWGLGRTVEVNALEYTVWCDTRWLPVCVLLAWLQVYILDAELQWNSDIPEISSAYVYQFVSHIFSVLTLVPLLAALAYYEAQYRPLRFLIDLFCNIIFFFAIALALYCVGTVLIDVVMSLLAGLLIGTLQIPAYGVCLSIVATVFMAMRHSQALKTRIVRLFGAPGEDEQTVLPIHTDDVVVEGMHTQETTLLCSTNNVPAHYQST